MRLLVEHVGIEKSGVHWRRLFGCTDGQEGGGGEKDRLGVVEDGFMNALTGEEEEAGRDGGKDEAAEDTEATAALPQIPSTLRASLDGGALAGLTGILRVVAGFLL